jgi:hypothetical protein
MHRRARSSRQIDIKPISCVRCLSHSGGLCQFNCDRLRLSQPLYCCTADLFVEADFLRSARFGGLRALSVGAGHGGERKCNGRAGQERYKTTDFLPVSVLHFRARQRRPWGGRRAFDHHRERTTTMASTAVYPTTIFPTIGRRNAVLMFLMGLGLILAIGWFRRSRRRFRMAKWWGE